MLTERTACLPFFFQIYLYTHVNDKLHFVGPSNVRIRISLFIKVYVQVWVEFLNVLKF